jgi:serine phosphatase RsbU (regulator of sigma subunit)
LSAFSRTIKGIFTEEFMAFFKSLAGQVGVAWRNAQQTEKLIEARRQEKELEIAKTIQLSLLPSEVPHIPKLSLAGTCEPASQVGGDYYDFLFKEGEYLDILIADVSGHNVGAALLMAQARTFIHAMANKNLSPANILCSLNEFFYEDLTKAELFITMFYIHFHVETGRFSYASAGHNPPFLHRGARNMCERLDAEGLILGVQRNVIFEEKKDILGQQDTLLLFTDGITEAQNEKGDFYGDSRLQEFLLNARQTEPEDMISHLLDEVQQFAGKENFEDDVSVVILKPQ